MSPIWASESLTPSQDVWGWVEPSLFRPYYGYLRQFTPTSSSLGSANFTFVDNEGFFVIDDIVTVPISNGPQGGRTGGWNGDKTKFAVIRTEGTSGAGTLKQFLTYVDAASDNPADWALGPDVVEVTNLGTDAPQAGGDLRFIPPDGTQIGWQYAESATSRFVLSTAVVQTGSVTTLRYSDLRSGVGHIRWYAYSPDGRWRAYGIEGNAALHPNGLIIIDPTIADIDDRIVYADPAADITSIFSELRLHMWFDDSSAFTYQAGDVTKVIAPQPSPDPWVLVRSFTTTDLPKPEWASPNGDFYYGASASPHRSRFFSSTGTILRTQPNANGFFDWNQEGTIACGAELTGATYALVRTPGFDTGGAVFVDNEGAYRMRPWL